MVSAKKPSEDRRGRGRVHEWDSTGAIVSKTSPIFDVFFQKREMANDDDEKKKPSPDCI